MNKNKEQYTEESTGDREEANGSHNTPTDAEYGNAAREQDHTTSEQPIAEREANDSRHTYLNFDPLAPYKGVLRRFLSIHRHLLGLLFGGVIAYVNALTREQKKGLRSFPSRCTAWLARPFIKREIRDLPFPRQLRRRLELLGPTYIKFGQILSLREDILPKPITQELKHLLDRLPEVPFDRMKEIMEENLGAPLDRFFETVHEKPLGSASIAQTHLARTLDGDDVVLKVVKPGIKDTVLTDLTLLKLLGVLLHPLMPQYRPRYLIYEFSLFTSREVNLEFEAENADVFQSNFADQDDIVFPRIYHHLSNENMLCMQYLDGFKPGSAPTRLLEEQEKEKLVDLGALSIIRMLYRDGFFHADLHPGNIIILPGPRLGFIDLGMVGRFDDRTRRILLYYFHALVIGDIQGATEYLLKLARIGYGSDPDSFHRETADLLRRYYQQASRGELSMGKMIIESLNIGTRHKIFFPIEMTLMVKALATYEGVGYMMDPNIDVPGVSRPHVEQIISSQFSLQRIGRELRRGAPELFDVLLRSPKIITEGIRMLELTVEKQRMPAESPYAGVRSSILAGSLLLGGVIALVQGGPWPLWAALFVIGSGVAMFGK